jgi:ABC-type transport system substrate-binding protein
MVPKGAETEAVARSIQSMASEAGFDMKIRVTEFATSLKQAEAGEYQAYLLAWSGRIDPDGNSYVFLKTEGAAELQRLVQSGGRQGARRRASRHRSGAAQGDL